MTDQVTELVNNLVSNINSKYPNTITDDQKKIILDHFLSQNKPIEEVEQELTSYSNDLLSQLDHTKQSKGYTQEELMTAYKSISDLTKFSDYSLYMDSDILPYIMTNQNSNKEYNELNILIDLKDIENFRSKLKITPYYKQELDTKEYVKDGNDYGFTADVDGVKVNITPYIKDKDSITKYKYENNKYVVEDIKDTKYLKTYKVNGEDIHSVSLEHIKRDKDLTGDIEVSKLIDNIGYSYDDYNSIIPTTKIKEVEANNINNVSSNEIVKNSLVNFVYDVKMNDQKTIPDAKLDEAVERLHNKPYDVIRSYLDKAKIKLNNKIELPKVLYDQQIEDIGLQRSRGYASTQNMAITIIIIGSVICLISLILKVI